MFAIITRWFAVAYLLLMFIILPVLVFLLSLGGPVLLLCVLVPVGMLLVFVAVVNTTRKYQPELLPSKLKSWNFLPLWLRSLQPYDEVIMRVINVCPCRRLNALRASQSAAAVLDKAGSESRQQSESENSQNASVNPAFEPDAVTSSKL
jgi:sodium-dependent phosphate cotransporter